MTLQPTEKLAHHLRRFPEDRQAKDRPGAGDRPATASWLRSVLLVSWLSSAWLLGLYLFGFATFYIKVAKSLTFRGVLKTAKVFPATCSALSTGCISGSRVAIPEVQVVIAAVVVVTVLAAADAEGGGALRKGKSAYSRP